MRAFMLVLCLICSGAHATAISDRMTLVEAIESVREAGVEITWSSSLVKPWMLVRKTPLTSDPVAGLGEALAVYGLALERGAQGQWLVVEDSSPVQPVVTDAVAAPPEAMPKPEPPLQIDEVRIIASRYSLYGWNATPDQFLSAEDIRLMPHVADDVFRAFHRLPGVAASDFSAPFNLRGGAVDEVKVVLDGLELFEAYHMRTLFNPLSIVDPRIIDNVNFMSGGFTADHGNHMSGVIDINSKWVNEAAIHETGVSFVNAFFRSAGPWGERGGYQFAARRGYLDLLADSVAVDDEEFSPRYNDVFAKAGFAVSDSTQFDVHTLYASDKVKYENVDESEYGVADSSLHYLWATLDTEPNDRARWRNVVFTGRVDTSDVGHSDNAPFEVIDRLYKRDVEILGLQSDISMRVSHSQLWMFGIRYRHLEADYEYELDSWRRSDILNGGMPLIIRRNTIISRSGGEFGAYARYRFRPASWWVWEIGLRWDRQDYADTGDDTQLSPRINTVFELGDDTDVRIGAGYYHQPQGIHELQVEDGVTRYFPASRARHIVAGLRHRFGSGLELQTDIYQKRYSDLRPRFENVLDSFEYAPESDFDRVRIDPESAAARGFEITLRDRHAGHFDWWFNYTWSKAEDTVEGIAIPRSWDQRHAVTGSLTWRGDKWMLSLVGRYHSGWPRTPLLLTPVLNTAGNLIGIDSDLSQRNQDRYDGYSRVDVRLSRNVDLEHGAFQFYVEIFNLLDTDNECCVAGHELNFGPSISASPNYDSYMPFFPSFGFVWRFGPGAG